MPWSPPTMYLPRLHREMGYELKPVRNSVVQRAGTGGSLTPINRTGDHWSVEIDVGTLSISCGRELLADIVRGPSERIRVMLPQNGIDIGAPGGLVVPHSDGSYFSGGSGYVSRISVDGDGQEGNTLAVKLFTPGYVARKGFFFTLETAAGSSAHILTETLVADASGLAELRFWPMLWRPPADNDAVIFSAPYFEGFIVDDGGQSFGVFKSVRTDSFVIEEG